MNIFTTIITATMYLIGAGLLTRRLRLGAMAAQQSKFMALGVGMVGALLHAVMLVQTLYTANGIDLAFFNVLSLTAWLVVAIVLLSALKHPLENLGVFILPIAVVALILQQITTDTGTPISDLSPGLEAHILLSLTSYSLLSIAVVQSLLLFIQDRQLRNRHPGGFIRALPPLETMETLLFQFIGLGYVLLSLSLVTGATYLENIFEQHLVHKTVLSVVAWVVFAILLWGRWKFGWRGRIAIRWTLAGFIVLMLAYFGSKMVLELIL